MQHPFSSFVFGIITPDLTSLLASNNVGKSSLLPSSEKPTNLSIAIPSIKQTIVGKT